MVVSRHSVDAAYHRASLLRAVQAAKPQLHGILLDVGCGQQPYRDILMEVDSPVTRYIGLDLNPGILRFDQSRYGRPDLVWDGRVMPLADHAVDCAMLTEVLEHCPEPRAVFREVRRVLRVGGCAFFTVPFLWPQHDAPHDEYRYTAFALKRLVLEAGFSELTLHTLGGWNASLAQMLGLWVKRAPMAPWRRSIMLRVLTPVIRFLAAHDKPTSPYENQVMVTGFWGLVR
jgi:ubiquinone/menaquinone biosynthesis C-methylase UbiE